MSDAWTNYCGLFKCKLGKIDAFRRTLDEVRRMRRRIVHLIKGASGSPFTSECLLTVYDSTRAHVRVRVPPGSSISDLAKALALAKWADSMLGGVNDLYPTKSALDGQVSRFRSVFTSAAPADVDVDNQLADEDGHEGLFDPDADDEDLDEPCGGVGLVNGLPWAITGLSCGEICFETTPSVIQEAQMRLQGLLASDSDLRPYLQMVRSLLPEMSGNGAELMRSLAEEELPLDLFRQLRDRLPAG
jgi:hypothetical protein